MSVSEDDETLPAQEPRIEDGRHQLTFFERINGEAYDRVHALEETVSLLEPETLDDVLTLAILLGAEVDRFNENYTDDAFEDRSDKDKRQCERDECRIERLRNAMIRGKFASSPIVSAGYLRDTWDTTPWSEELATAEAELAKLPRKREADPDPTDSATQH